MADITNGQARRFVLRKQGLLGGYRYRGKQGALDYIRAAGCIQFDPVDVCGQMAELTLASRVRGFKREHLAELLYRDRALFDYPDKQLSIIPTEDWAYYRRYRALARQGGEGFEGLAELETQALAYIEAHGPVTAGTLPLSGKLYWHSQIHWSGAWHGESDAARSVLEQLYSTGELVIHHKNGTHKVYDLASRHIPQALLSAPEPLPELFRHQMWRVARRVGAAGLVWDRASGYWNNVWGLDASVRHRAFRALEDQGVLLSLTVEGERQPFYCLAADLPLLEEARTHGPWRPRCEALAPLDPFLWDKALTRALFGFDYAWEIYTPAPKRKYGAYVLPLLYGERFIGRLEAVNDRRTGTLRVRHIWYEDGVRRTQALCGAVEECVTRLARLQPCASVVWEGDSHPRCAGDGAPAVE